MITRWVAAIAIFVVSIVGSASAQSSSRYSVEIDLQTQTAYLLDGHVVVLSTPICSGRAGHYTETGSFRIIEKERNHFSNMYGQIVDAGGNVVVTDGDADMPVPRGGKFVPAPMRYFMRFNGAIGMHAGYLPGYPASHGCVRMPEQNAIAFFNAIEVGTPVTVFGTTPRGRSRDDSYDDRYGQQLPRGRQQSVRRLPPGFDPRLLERRWR